MIRRINQLRAERIRILQSVQRPIVDPMVSEYPGPRRFTGYTNVRSGTVLRAPLFRLCVGQLWRPFSLSWLAVRERWLRRTPSAKRVIAREFDSSEILSPESLWLQTYFAEFC
jgi:hypothetical protein